MSLCSQFIPLLCEVRDMSFSLQVKGELARLPILPDQTSKIKAELAGLVRAGGWIRGSSGTWALEIILGHSPTARRAFRLFKMGLGVHCDIILKKRRSPRSFTQYVVRVPPEECRSTLKALGVLLEGGYASSSLPALVKGAPARRAYLRGSFLGSGSVTNPEKAHHLEIRFGTEEAALALEKVLRKEGITPGMRERFNGWLIYLKECEDIVSFLGLIQAHSAVLRYENVRVLRDVRSRVNRAVNCETANVSKAVEAGLKQVEDIHLIDRLLGLGSLPPALRELAELRLEHPEVSIKELGSLLDPPLSKSGANHRLRRIRKMASVLRARD